MATAQSVDDCEIPLPLSFLINDGGSGVGYFVGVGLLTDRWGGSLVWSAGWWGGGGLIVLVIGGGIWV